MSKVKMEEKVLIIKHGALGDWILSTGVFKLIRKHHPKAKIIFLTSSAYRSLAEQSSWFDEIWIDNRQGFLVSLKIILKIRAGGFSHIYDIQRSARTRYYYYAIKRPRLYWSGNVKGCSGYFMDDLQKHIVERMALQLRASGINDFPDPDISWLKADISTIKPESPYVLIIAGCAKHRPKKRWSAKAYAEVIGYFASKNIQSVLIGTDADREIIEAILHVTSHAKPINLMNKTSFAQLAELSRHCLFVLGSDTGSIHIAAATGAPSLTLFCLSESNPNFNRAWGVKAKTITVPDLKLLPASEVIKAIEKHEHL